MTASAKIEALAAILASMGGLFSAISANHHLLLIAIPAALLATSMQLYMSRQRRLKQSQASTASPMEHIA